MMVGMDSMMLAMREVYCKQASKQVVSTGNKDTSSYPTIFGLQISFKSLIQWTSLQTIVLISDGDNLFDGL